LKIKSWPLEECGHNKYENIRLTLLNTINEQGWHLRKWMKDEKIDYVSIVTVGIVKGVNVVRIIYSI